MSKRCSKCGRTLPITDFHRNAAKQDGHRCSCKQCIRASLRDDYKKHRLRRIAYQKYYHECHERPPPDRVARRAQDLLQQAVKKGDIIRPNNCSKCGKLCTPEGHHEDYARPLDVEWLCCACHRKLNWIDKEVPVGGASGQTKAV